MIQPSTSSPNVSLPLAILVHDLLRDQHYVPISTLTAEIILMHTGNKHTCHIQMPSDSDVDILGRFIDKPMLWDWAAWKSSSEKYLLEKIRSQQRRDIKFVYEGNVKLIARAILRMAYITPDAAIMLGHKFMKSQDWVRIKAVGVKRLYENVKELPDK